MLLEGGGRGGQPSEGVRVTRELQQRTPWRIFKRSTETSRNWSAASVSATPAPTPYAHTHPHTHIPLGILPSLLRPSLFSANFPAHYFALRRKTIHCCPAVELAQLFQDMAILVESQGELINSIDNNGPLPRARNAPV